MQTIPPLCNSDNSEEGTKKINKLKPHGDITTAVLSHNITSLPERSKELWREDAEQEALGKHLQDGCATDNPKMF